MMMKRCGVHQTAWILLIVGGLNWGLVGLGGWNVVNIVLGSVPLLERLVYVLVGVAALLALAEGKCKMCLAVGK